MGKRTSREFRPAPPLGLEERLAPGNFLGNLGNSFTRLGRSLAEPYVRLGNRIIGEDMTPPKHPTFSSMQIRRWTVIARVVSGEMSAPVTPPAMPPDIPR